MSCPWIVTAFYSLLTSGCWLLLSQIAVAQESSQISPARGYCYLEPYQLRFECLVRMKEALSILGENDTGNLSGSAQTRLKDKTRSLAADWLELKFDGVSVSAKPTNVSIVKGVPGRTEPIGAGDNIVTADSMIGLIWEIPLPNASENIEIKWNGFSQGLPSVPITMIAGTQIEDFTLTSTSPKHLWKNSGGLRLRQPLAEVPPLPPPLKFMLPLGSILWLIVGFFVFKKKRHQGRKVPGRAFTTWASLLLGAAVLWRVLAFEVTAPWTIHQVVTTNEAGRVLTALLRNTYRAFDQHEESAIYDVLARSINGELLQKIYLQTSNALTLDGQDGTRVVITELYVEIDGVKPSMSGAGFQADGSWTALGTVGHWGHMHNRVNRYTAKITVEPVGGEWKMTEIQVMDERRL